MVSYQLIRIKVLAEAAHPCPQHPAKIQRPALPPRKPGVSAHVAPWRNGSGLLVSTCASKTRSGPKANARPLSSLFLLVSVTPASQFLLTARGGILVHYTSPVVTERKLAHRGGLFVFRAGLAAQRSRPCLDFVLCVFSIANTRHISFARTVGVSRRPVRIGRAFLCNSSLCHSLRY
jgi:hypothetical protein